MVGGAGPGNQGLNLKSRLFAFGKSTKQMSANPGNERRLEQAV
jgi:hypothetical protein